MSSTDPVHLQDRAGELQLFWHSCLFSRTETVDHEQVHATFAALYSHLGQPAPDVLLLDTRQQYDLARMALRPLLRMGRSTSQQARLLGLDARERTQAAWTNLSSRQPALHRILPGWATVSHPGGSPREATNRDWCEVLRLATAQLGGFPDNAGVEFLELDDAPRPSSILSQRGDARDVPVASPAFNPRERRSARLAAQRARQPRIPTWWSEIDDTAVVPLDNLPLPFAGVEADLGQVDSLWLVRYDLLERLGSWRDPQVALVHTLAALGIWNCCPMDDLVVAYRRPRVVHVDDGGLPHCTDGPAIEWCDGEKGYYVRGSNVPEECAMPPHKIPAWRILEEHESRVRHALLLLAPREPFVEETRSLVVDEDIDRAGQPRRLLRMETWPRVSCVEVRCPSTGEFHLLRVPPGMERCSQAVAWTFGFTVPDLYAPIMEA